MVRPCPKFSYMCSLIPPAPPGDHLQKSTALFLHSYTCAYTKKCILHRRNEKSETEKLTVCRNIGRLRNELSEVDVSGSRVIVLLLLYRLQSPLDVALKELRRLSQERSDVGFRIFLLEVEQIRQALEIEDRINTTVAMHCRKEMDVYEQLDPNLALPKYPIINLRSSFIK